jgi:hypothetical protein
MFLHFAPSPLEARTDYHTDFERRVLGALWSGGGSFQRRTKSGSSRDEVRPPSSPGDSFDGQDGSPYVVWDSLQSFDHSGRLWHASH